jgi:hypothetical protein
VKVGVTTSIPHRLTPPNGFWCIVDVV